MSAAESKTVVTLSETPENGRRRFSLELEFVSLCSDPSYLQYLGSKGLLKQASFILYLRYLVQTWSKPAYASYLRHPLGLLHLQQLVEDEGFRERMTRFDQASALRQAELDLWKGRGEEILRETALLVAEFGK